MTSVVSEGPRCAVQRAECVRRLGLCCGWRRLPAWHQVWALVTKPWEWGGFQEVTLVAPVGWGQGHRCFLIFLGAAVPSHGTTTLRK